MEKKEKLYKIGEVASMLGVHEDTLRNWDKEGLVVADRIGKRRDRRYNGEHIKQIKEKGLVSNLTRRTNKMRNYEDYTKEQLIKELQILKQQKKFGLVWEEKTEEVVEQCKKQAPILESVPEMSVQTSKHDLNHIMIEGDNYHALQVLNYTHKGKIDVIYIDPPYNTGKDKEWKYNDKYVDSNDDYRHSKWLSMMYKRLISAKELLSAGGVIFISIDDNEQATLKLLCDRIFESENFITNFVWEKNFAPKNDNKYISTSHEYIFLYSKNKSLFKRNLLPREEKHDKGYTNPDNDPRGAWTSGSMLATTFSEKYVYQIIKPNKDKVLPPEGRCWRYSQAKVKELMDDDRIWFGKDGKNIPRVKRFLSEVQSGVVPASLLKHSEVASGQDGTNDLRLILGKQAFDFPKPQKLIQHLLKIASQKTSIILDFFAGSGTTAHAVLELNKQDGGNRQVIVCTNNENNNGNGSEGIARGVCQPRIKKVIQGYTKQNGKNEKVEGLGGNLKYFKTDFVDVKNIHDVTDDDKLKLTEKVGQMIALKENAFEQVEKNKFYQIFTDQKDKFVGVYFSEDLEKLQEFEDKILEKPEVKLYMFSYEGSDDWKSDYEEYNNVQVQDIPEPILRVYRGLSG